MIPAWSLGDTSQILSPITIGCNEIGEDRREDDNYDDSQAEHGHPVLLEPSPYFGQLTPLLGLLVWFRLHDGCRLTGSLECAPRLRVCAIHSILVYCINIFVHQSLHLFVLRFDTRVDICVEYIHEQVY